MNKQKTVSLMPGFNGTLLIFAISILIVCILTLIKVLTSPQSTELPPDMPSIEIRHYGAELPGYLIGKLYFEMASFAPDSPNYIIEMEHGTGRITFAQQIDGFGMKFERHNENLMSYWHMPGSNFANIFNPQGFDGIPFATGGDLVLLNRDYQTVTTISERRGVDLHELLILDNGNMVFFVSDVRPMYKDPTLTCLPRCQILGQTLVEVTPEGEVAFEWSALDHYQRSDFVMDDMLIWDNTMLYDVIHANSIDVDSDGNYLVSIRHTSQVLKVDRQTGDVIWALGKNGDFTFIDDSANGFSHQHDAHWLENGHLLLFDNGNDYANPVSNVVEYEIDEQSLEVRLVWAYSTEDHHFAPNRGSAQRLPNGNTLINWVSRQPNIQEVTPEGELVLEITLPDNYASYQTQFWGK
jgi:hypothetical protein